MDSELERQALVILPELLNRVPGLIVQQVRTELSARPIPNDETSNTRKRLYKPDLEIIVTLIGEENGSSPQTPTASWQLYVEVAGHIDARKLQSISAYTHDMSQTIPMLFVPHISPEKLEACQKIGVCCADAAGNGWIALGNRVYIERIGNKALSAGTIRSISPLSSPKTENVLRVLLNAAGAVQRPWRLQSLAAEAGVSLGQAARVKGILEKMGVAENLSKNRHVGGFRLSHPEEALQEWAGYVRARSYHIGEEHMFYAIDEPQELQRMLTRKLPSFVYKYFALSGPQSAEFYAPYARSPIFSAYVLPNAEVNMNDLVDAMDLERVTRGINVALTIPRDSGVFYLPPDLRQGGRETRVIEKKIPVVSPVQTYLDLQRLGGRAKEGAHYLLEQYLRPRWQKELTDDNRAE